MPLKGAFAACLLIGLAGCGLWPLKQAEPAPPAPPPAAEPVLPEPAAPPSASIPTVDAPEAAPTSAPEAAEAITVTPAAPEPTPATPGPPSAEPVKPLPMPWLKAARYADLPGWRQDDLSLAWPALSISCKTLVKQPAWRRVCQASAQLYLPDRDMVRGFFERHFTPYQVNQTDGATEGLVTGYYEPLLRGSRRPSAKYGYPLYGPPEDLLIVDLASVYPELKTLRLRGRLDGRRVVPYFTRAEIEDGQGALRGKELIWVDDPVELFFLQVQGSGRVRLESGEVVRIGYADQNGHPYRSIGKWLVDKGELTLDKASMQGIKDWGRRNPDKLPGLLGTNPSYVFFREMNDGLSGPVGALGVPLTAERSIAVDPRGIPLGAPIWLATTRPNSKEPLIRLVLAQDTGSAIRGNVRADFFWGFGEEAGKLAGAMKQKGRMWVLLPRDYPVSGNGAAGL